MGTSNEHVQNHDMTTFEYSHKTFEFEDCNSSEILRVSIPEVIDDNYGTYIWPSAPVLGQYIWNNRKLVGEKTVIELGAGTSLPGLVAAKSGSSKVYFTDSSRYPLSLLNCKKSFEDCMKSTSAEVLEITWGEIGPNLSNLEAVDFIIGSDCFYDTADFDDLLMIVSFLFDRNPKAQFWTAYQERSSDWNIGVLLKKWGLGGRRVHLAEFCADPTNIGASGLPGNHNIHLYIITKL